MERKPPGLLPCEDFQAYPTIQILLIFPVWFLVSSCPSSVVRPPVDIQTYVSCFKKSLGLHILITSYFMSILQIILAIAVDLGFYISINHFAATELNSVM